MHRRWARSGVGWAAHHGQRARRPAVNSEDETLKICLAMAVPLRIDELLCLQPDARMVRAQQWISEAGELVPHAGDAVFRITPYRPARGKWIEEVGTARAFNALACGLAAGALVPGGVTFAGLHWSADPDQPAPRGRRRPPRAPRPVETVRAELLEATP